MAKRTKYNAKSVVVDGIRFPSIHESKRYRELKLLEKAGQIRDLQLQVPFRLLDSQRIGGRVVERPVDYRADFAYVQDGKYVVEDAKGVRTPEYVIKRKLMLWVHGIRVREV